MTTTFVNNMSWADMEDEEDARSVSPATKLSYASIASKGVLATTNNIYVSTWGSDSEFGSESVDDSASDFSDFTVVSHKKHNKQMLTKCENAVVQWAKNKGQISKPNKCNGDDEIICNRCSSPFIFNAKTKEKYAEKKWTAPKICKMCSQMRYEERNI